MSSHFGLMPLTASTIVVSPAGASTAVPGIKRGVLYRVMATAAVNLELNNGAATASKGFLLAPNVEELLMFGMGDIQGTDPTVNVFGTATVYFTPVVSVTI
jgi:hypothetical protein